MIPGSRPAWTSRVGATLLVLGLWLVVGWLAWELTWPGPAVDLTLERPALRQALPLHRPVVVSGRVSSTAETLRCATRHLRPDANGRFWVSLPGPTRPGMFVLPCRARNRRGKIFLHPHARLAGATAPLTSWIADAVVLQLPLSILQARGGLLAQLSQLVTERLAPLLDRFGRKMSLVYKGFRLGPLKAESVVLLNVEASGPNQLRLTLGLRHPQLGIQLAGADSKSPGSKRWFSRLLTRPHTVRLPGTLRVRVKVHWPPGGQPEVSILGINTRHLTRVARYKWVTDALAELVGPLSHRLKGWLARAGGAPGGLVQALNRAWAALQQRLARLAALLPQVPAAVSPAKPRVCLDLRLSHMTTHLGRTVRFHLQARMRGVALPGKACPKKALPPLLAAKRLTLGPPALTTSAGQPVLALSHDLINAYLATLWASGTIARVPVRLPAMKQHGFDIRGLSYRLPPVITTAKAGRLRLEVPELGVLLYTLGEPERLFAVHLRLWAKLTMLRPGRVRLAVTRDAPPRLFLRCERQAGSPCAPQSRRFQDLTDIATEIAMSGRIPVPDLALEAALPAVSSQAMRIEVQHIQAVPRGLRVHLATK